MPGKPKICETCKKTPASSGYPEKEIVRCGKCKESGMINLTIKKCVVCKTTIPIYGIVGGKPTHCKGCKLDTMVDIKTKKCIKCKLKQPTFGELGKKPEYCVDCKTDSMVDIKSSKCEVCKVKQPFFGLPDSVKSTHCAKCKTPAMIDLKSKKCIICKIKNPVFGLPGGKRTHCKDCKLDTYVDVKNTNCIVCNSKQATYGDVNTKKATHCKGCKLDNYIDVKHTICKTALCETRANPELRGHCSWCFQHLFPDDPLSKQIFKKTAETEVATIILNYDKNYKHNTTLTFGGCDCNSRRRVDFWKVINNTILAIEVDENQHKRYDTYDETIRYDDLYMIFSGKWVFIRFNPDSFKGDDGRIKRVDMLQRLEELLRHIQHHEARILKEDNKELLEIHRLFFDEKQAV